MFETQLSGNRLICVGYLNVVDALKFAILKTAGPVRLDTAGPVRMMIIHERH